MNQRGVNVGRDFLIAGLQTDVRLTEVVRLDGSYDIQASTNQTRHLGSVGMEFAW